MRIALSKIATNFGMKLAATCFNISVGEIFRPVCGSLLWPNDKCCSRSRRACRRSWDEAEPADSLRSKKPCHSTSQAIFICITPTRFLSSNFEKLQAQNYGCADPLSFYFCHQKSANLNAHLCSEYVHTKNVDDPSATAVTGTGRPAR